MNTKFFAIFLFFAAFISSNAQLKNTKWKATLNIPTPTECVIQFSNHTASLLYEGDVVEYMWFMEDNNVMSIGKYWGGSPCKADSELVGKYKIIHKGNTVMFEVIEEQCPGRADSFKNAVFTKL